MEARTKTPTFRVSEKELSTIKKRADEADYTFSEFVRRMSLEGLIYSRFDRTILRALTDIHVELQRQGNNLNQISKRVNQLAYKEENNQEIIPLIGQLLERGNQGRESVRRLEELLMDVNKMVR